ncbi:hypothetical protein PHLCEN_2v6102 [Hermanssonia centrifuga]|uniref:Uncharacterized protein n=1 Tax=Hermanssonia centrifuga TaxID=98765 RepID=A0A2R6P0D7_9APHY|nr:hypothetical protein PHLCEN_2v6102 [Hermanssonia centrifuga]
MHSDSPSPTPPTRKRRRRAVQNEDHNIDPDRGSADNISPPHPEPAVAQEQSSDRNRPVIVGINREELYEIKRKTEYLRNIIENLKATNHTACQEIEALTQENANLLHTNRRLLESSTSGNDDEHEEQEDGPPSKKSKTSPSNKIFKMYLRLGKQFSACQIMWLSPEIWDFLYTSGNTPEDEDEESYNQRTRMEAISAQLMEFLPDVLHEQLNEDLFRDRFSHGMRAIRARFVADLVQSHAMVFGILDTAFLIKEERRELPAVKELIADDTFLYKPGTDELNGLLRHPSLKKALLLLLWGPSTLNCGDTITRPKTKRTNGRLWGLEATTDALLAFGATAIYFVLSCEAEFGEVGPGGTNFQEFYEERITDLTDLHAKFPNRYKKLMKYYNNDLFHNYDNQDASAVQNERQGKLALAMEMEVDDEDSSDDN